MWRDAECYRRDFEAFGVADCLDAIVSSVDVGIGKPNPVLFAAAVSAAGCRTEECVMIGNSEVNDIIPAGALGMRCVRVAIEEPEPASSQADAVVTTLPELRTLLCDWVGKSRATNS